MLAAEIRAKDMEDDRDDIVLLSSRSGERHCSRRRCLLMHPAGLGNVKALLAKAVGDSRECKGQKVDFCFHSP